MLRNVPDTRQATEVRCRRTAVVRRGATKVGNEVDGHLSTF